MAIAPTDIGVAGVVAMFAIDKIYNLANKRKNGKEFRCAKQPHIIENLERNKQTFETVKTINSHLSAMKANTDVMVNILRNIERNGR